MKKRIIALSLILIMSLSGCGKENKGTDHMGNNNTVPGETIAEKTTAEKTTAEKTTAEKTTAEKTSAKNTSNNSGGFEKLVNLYDKAIGEKWTPDKLIENDMPLVMADCYGTDPSKNIGITVKDIDGNGIMDMVVGTTAAITDEFYGKMIFALYTLDQQGNPKAVFISEARDRYYYEGGSLFAHIGSSSASDSLNTTMEYKNGKMVDTGRTANPSLYVQMNY